MTAQRPTSSSHRAACWVGGVGLLMSGCTHPLTIQLLPPAVKPAGPSVFLAESFDQLDVERWREVEVRGQTQYAAVEFEGRRCLKADSRAGASILLSSARYDPDDYEWLSWQWRVDQLVSGEALERKDGSDAAARVYVYFDTPGLPWNRRNLDYVWSASLPVGTLLSSAYSANSKIIVVESGPEHLGRWQTVVRNIEDDYEAAFGEDPPDVVAMGIMTDTDNTGSQAVAYFDDLRVSRQAPHRSRTDSDALEGLRER